MARICEILRRMVAPNLVVGASVGRAQVDSLAAERSVGRLDAKTTPTKPRAPAGRQVMDCSPTSTSMVPLWKSRPGTKAKVSMSGAAPETLRRTSSPGLP